MFHIFCKTLPNSDGCLHLQPCLGHCSAGLSGSSYRKSKEAFVAEFLAIRKYHGMGFYMFLSPLIPLSIGTYWNQSHDSCVVVWNEVLLLGPGRAAFGLLRGYWLAC